jgi:HPt (histidine-containing phosphotransfer) domain-containing protein
MVFNREILLERTMGDEELARDVAAGFIADLPKMLSALKEDFARGDIESIWKQAHRLKGSTANVGGETLRDVALEIGQAGRAGNLTAVTRWMPDLEIQTASLHDVLEQWAI